MITVLSQDKKTLVVEADYFSVECYAATELPPTIYYHRGTTAKNLATYAKQEDAERVLNVMFSWWNTESGKVVLPKDDTKDIDDFCTEPIWFSPKPAPSSSSSVKLTEPLLTFLNVDGTSIVKC